MCLSHGLLLALLQIRVSQSDLERMRDHESEFYDDEADQERTGSQVGITKAGNQS